MLSYSKATELFFKIWKDAVWSKVIAGAILAVFGTWAYLTFNSFKVFVLNILRFELPIYVTILFAVGIYLLKLALVNFRQNAQTKPYDINQEIVGDYTFGELVQILTNTKITERNDLMEHHNIDLSEESVLVLFTTFYNFLNRGVSQDSKFDEHGFLWGILAPKLVDYKLMKTVEQGIYSTKEVSPSFITSEEGRKFYLLIQKSRMFSKAQAE